MHRPAVAVCEPAHISELFSAANSEHGACALKDPKRAAQRYFALPAKGWHGRGPECYP
jgi:hypothetical protein